MRSELKPADWSRLRVRGRDPAQRPQMAEGPTPLSAGLTPVDEFFIVHHYPPAEVQPETWSLEVKGRRGSKTVVLSDLHKLPEHSVTALIECAGMSRGLLPEARLGTQFGHGMVGTAKWTGVRLRDVLEASGIDHDFETLIVRGGDSGTTQPEDEHSDFSKGLPREKALDDDTLLALLMNDEPLPYLHGGPVRLVVPGWFGIWWVKWPRVIETSTEKGYNGFWQGRRYTYQTPEGDQIGVVREQLPRSVISTPRDGEQVPRGALTVSGVAWAGQQKVAKVEVSIDRGRSWIPAEIADSQNKWSWVSWTTTVEFNGPTGFHPISARTTDVSGRVQDWASVDNRLGYGNNRIDTIKVDVVA